MLKASFEGHFVDKVFVCRAVDFKDSFYRVKGDALVGLVDDHLAVSAHFRAERNAVGKLSCIRAAGGADRLAFNVARDLAICIHKHLNHLGIGIDFEALGIGHKNDFHTVFAL